MTAAPNPIIPELASIEMRLATPRLRLRAFADDDVDAIYPVVSDPEFPKQMTWAAHTDRAQTLAFIASTREGRARGTELVWAIEHGGRAVGAIGLHSITWWQRAWRVDRATLGYWLAPALWSQGVMTEAATAVVRFAFTTLGLHKLVTGHVAGNPASQRVIEKLGFRLVGRAEEHLFRDGRWVAHLDYELLADDPADIELTQPITRPSAAKL